MLTVIDDGGSEGAGEAKIGPGGRKYVQGRRGAMRAGAEVRSLVSFRVTPSVLVVLRREAERRGVSVSQLIASIVESWKP